MKKRTQIYLTQDEYDALSEMSSETGRTHSDLIREAIDMYVSERRDANREQLLDAGLSLWRDREDLPDFNDLRREWDRSQ